MENQLRQIMRLMAWERAKGELKSMLQTHVLEQDQYQSLRNVINEFIKDVENNGRHE